MIQQDAVNRKDKDKMNNKQNKSVRLRKQTNRKTFVSDFKQEAR